MSPIPKMKGDNETRRFFRLAGPRPSDEDECWIWAGGTSHDGYGMLRADRLTEHGTITSKRAHRVSYEIHVGPIPDGHQLDHLCRNKRCVNPKHLEPVTASENMWRVNVGTCRAGHPRTPENLYYNKLGHRMCRTCQRIWKGRAREALGA